MATAKSTPSVSVVHNTASGFYELGAKIGGVFVAFARVPEHVVSQAIADASATPPTDTDAGTEAEG